MSSLLDILVVLSLMGVAFVLVTMVCFTLAMDHHHAIERHELIRQARIQRAEYLAALERRINGDAPPEQAEPAPAISELLDVPEAQAAVEPTAAAA